MTESRKKESRIEGGGPVSIQAGTGEPARIILWFCYFAVPIFSAALMGAVYQLFRELITLINDLCSIHFPWGTLFLYAIAIPLIFIYCKGVALVLDRTGRCCKNRSYSAHLALGWTAGAVGAYVAWVVFANVVNYQVAAQSQKFLHMPDEFFVWQPQQVLSLICKQYGDHSYHVLESTVSGIPVAVFWCFETALLVLAPPFCGGNYIFETTKDQARFIHLNSVPPPTVLRIEHSLPRDTSDLESPIHPNESPARAEEPPASP